MEKSIEFNFCYNKNIQRGEEHFYDEYYDDVNKIIVIFSNKNIG